MSRINGILRLSFDEVVIPVDCQVSCFSFLPSVPSQARKKLERSEEGRRKLREAIGLLRTRIDELLVTVDSLKQGKLFPNMC